MSAGENLVVLLLLLVLVVPVIAAWYAYRREEKGDLEYALSYWFGGLPGMYVYRSYQEKSGPEKVRQCPNCSTAYTGNPEFCSSCGTQFGEVNTRKTTSIVQSGQLLFCRTCKSELESDATHCDGSGRAID